MDNNKVSINTANAMASLLATQSVSLGKLITENQELNTRNAQLQETNDKLREELKKYQSK